MGQRALGRSLRFACTGLGLVFLSFGLMHVGQSDFDPTSEVPREEQRRRFRARGADRPVLQRFRCWWVGHSASGCQWWQHGEGILRGDLGQSTRYGRSVASLLSSRIGTTVQVMLPSWLIAVLASTVLGAWSAIMGGRWWVRIGGTLGPALAHHWWAMVVVVLLHPWMRHPAGSYLLAVLSTASFFTLRWMPWVEAHVTTLAKASFVDGLRSRGVSEIRIALHVSRNAVVPLGTLFGQWFPIVFVGSLVVERVFVLPGVGSLFVEAVHDRDLPLAGALFGLYSLVSLGSVACIDLLSWLDPRERLGR